MSDLISRLQVLAKTYPTPGVEATVLDTIAEVARLQMLEQRWRNEYGEAMEQLRQRSDERDTLRTLLQDVINCADLFGWPLPEAAPLYDRIAAALGVESNPLFARARVWNDKL